MFKLGFASLLGMTLAFAATTSACSSVEHAYDCNQICNRYEDCFDSTYDSSACASKCRDKADDEAYGNKAEDCQACIDDKSCTESFACANECLGIVP